MNKDPILLTPGTTPVPERILKAMSQCNIHHRSEEFTAILQEVWNNLRFAFQTQNPVYLLASSGTGGMEAAVANAFSPGDKVIVVDSGKFGERWGGIGKVYGLEVVTIKVEWGRAVDPQQIGDLLRTHPDTVGVLFQACETSTGVMHPVKGIADIVHENSDALLVCDAITGTGVFSIPADEWGIDIVVSGSQKAFMLPPGLAFISASPRAWKRIEQCSSPRFYLDLKRERKSYEKGTTAYTPAISLILGLREALLMMRDEGLSARFERTASLAQVTQEGFKSMGLELFASNALSPSLTAVKSPPGIDSGQLVKKLRSQYNIWIAGGQDQLKGKIFRVSHMGAVGAKDLAEGMKAINNVLTDLGAQLSFNQQQLEQRFGEVS